MPNTLLVLLLTLMGLAANAGAQPVAVSDLKWLNRLGYGVNSQTIADFQAQGRKDYLERQLTAPANADYLPPAINAAIAALPISQRDNVQMARELRARFHGLNQLPVERRQAQRAERRQASDELLDQTRQRHLLRAVYSPWQLKQLMTWFWLNHFNVFSNKGDVRLVLADYEESAIRPHALGHFRNLVMATLRHPAMLIYLDNAHNAAGKINENYARELMELHTLGVDGGYSQQDVEALARILTGVGINWQGTPPKMSRHLRPYHIQDGLFEFNPKRHDFGDKRFLGHTIKGGGFAEVEQAVDLLVRHPATAKFISRKLAVYFVADNPPPALVDRAAKTFQDTNGDIPATLRTLFESQEFADSLGTKIRDPMHFVMAGLRLVYDGQTITDTAPVVRWLHKLDQPLYGRSTPDGYGMTEKDWVSPSQLTERFTVAKQMANSRLAHTARPGQKLAERPLFRHLEPLLSEQTLGALAKARTPQEWNIFLLSSPEFLYR